MNWFILNKKEKKISDLVLIKYYKIVHIEFQDYV